MYVKAAMVTECSYAGFLEILVAPPKVEMPDRFGLSLSMEMDGTSTLFSDPSLNSDSAIDGSMVTR